MAEGAEENQESESSDLVMSLGDHLDDLRLRIIWSLVGLGVTCAVTLYFGANILSWVLSPMVRVLAIFGLPHNLVATGVTTGFTAYFMVSLIAGLIISFPWILYQMWCFVRTGLYDNERKIFVVLAPFSAVMSVLSVLFLYYVLLPITLSFMIVFTINLPPVEVPKPGEGGSTEYIAEMVRIANGYGKVELPTGPETATGATGPVALGKVAVVFVDPTDAKVGDAWIKQPEGELRVKAGEKDVLSFPGLRNHSPIQPLMNTDDYLSFVWTLALGTLLAFQLPVVMTTIGWTGLINPDTIAAYRKYCFFLSFVIAAIASPPDVLSMMALGVPIYGLFEMGLFCMKLAYRHATRNQPVEEEGDEGY